jgi:hypothetical protein
MISYNAEGTGQVRVGIPGIAPARSQVPNVFKAEHKDGTPDLNCPPVSLDRNALSMLSLYFWLFSPRLKNQHTLSGGFP